MRKIVDEYFRQANEFADKHVLITVPRMWFEQREAIIKDQQNTIAELNRKLAAITKADKLTEMEGPYHFAGCGCAVKVIDRKNNKLQLHFPKNWKGLEEMVLEADYDPVIDKIDIKRDGKVVLTGYFGWKTNGGHTITFGPSQYWLHGSAN